MSIGIGLAAASTVASMAGQYAQGQAAYTQSKYEGAAATANATLAAEQAKHEIDNTQLAAKRRYREASQLEGNQKAAMAANGIDLQFGSAVDIQRDDKMIAREDVSQIYTEGFNKTQGYLIDAYNYRLKAKAAKAAGTAAKWSTGIGMAGTALGGASQINRMASVGFG